MKHPFLFYSAHDIDKYREKLKKDPQAKARYDSIVASADKCLKEPIVSWKELNGGISQHANFGMMSGQARKWLNTLGLKYLVERDEKCAEKLKGLLLKYISFERWFGIAYTKRTPVPWHSDLSSTATTLACGMIYDAIHDYLTEEERKQISEGLFEKGILSALGDWALPETRIHAIDSMGHNWWAVCIAESATALLALQDQLPQARVKEVFGYVNEALATYLSYKGNVLFNKFGNFDDQGMFYESVGYNNYGTGTLLRYLWCYERYFGRNDVIRKEIPPRLCDGVMGFSYPVSREDGKVDYLFLNYGDSSLHTQIGLLGTYAYRNGLDTSALRACIKNYGVDIWEEIGGLDLSHLEGSAESLEKTMIYSSGYAVTRDSWKPDATLLSVKSGFCWNHSHNDSGSFVIFHKGKEFFNDDGSCSYYGNVKDLYHNYYCQDHAHSVLKVGGKGRRDEELYRGTKFIGRIIDHYQNKDLLFLQTDCTGPMAHLVSRMYRNFVWIDSRILVIVDDVFAHAEDTVQFTLHYNGTYENKDDGVYFTYEDCR
ncbi:MAG: heparinase II/III family protein, partial [Clostridia bacterium]|nr:heparinase II/III family protein [Clostridia bacterium]